MHGRSLRSRATREATRGHPAAGLLSLASSASPSPEQPPAKPDGANDGSGRAFYPLQHSAVGAPTGNRQRGGDASRRLRRHRRPEVAVRALLLADLAPLPAARSGRSGAATPHQRRTRRQLGQSWRWWRRPTAADAAPAGAVGARAEEATSPTAGTRQRAG
uniref:Uncharacterized protein n=1 Tax=Oryza meridionalis TaxID=40149 RepID=A0A0E0CS89_9ORYZ